MLVVGAGILGAVTLEEFSIALLVGLLSGAYSSIFVATPIAVYSRSASPGTGRSATDSSPAG